MNYELRPNRFYRLKPEYSGAGPARVSLFGAAPRPAEAYEIAEEGFSIYDRRNNTYSNYFFGRIGIASREEGEDIIARLDGAARDSYYRSIDWSANQLAIDVPPISDLEKKPLEAVRALARELANRVNSLSD